MKAAVFLTAAPPRSAFRVAALAFAQGAVVAAFAQVPNATTPSYLPPKESAMLLEKFEVNGQRENKSYATPRSVTATKTDTPLVNVPQSISVVTRELIDDQAMHSIGDVTRYVPGAGIAQGEGNRDTPVLRGNSTTADFFVDGIRDDVQYFRDLYTVDRVEVLKGPNAMIFGRGGSGGLINRVSKQANGATTRELSLLFGSWNQFRATLDAGEAISPTLAFRVTALIEDADSYRDDVTLRRYGLNPTLAWRLAPRTTLRAGLEHFHDERVADRGISSYQGRPVHTAASTFFGDPAQSTSDATVNTAFVALDHTFANRIALRNHTRFGRYEKSYQNVYPGAVNAAGTTVALSAYNQATDRDNLFNQTDVILPFATGSVQHQVLAGLELARQETDNLRLTGYFTTVSPTTTSISVPLSAPRSTLPLTFQPSTTDAHNRGVAQTVAVYAQDQIALLPQLHAIVGVRLEKFTVDFRNHRTAQNVASRDRLISPRAGLIYKPAEQVSFYASTSMSSMPRAGEQLSSLSLSNRALDPEEFTNHELGAKWDLRPDLALSAAVYRLDRSNVAITDPANPTRSLLVDGQRAKGVELGLTGRLTANWSVVGGYAYQDGTIKTTQSATVVAGARLAQLPRHTFSLWHRYDLNRQWGLGLGTIYRDAMFASTDNTVRLPGFARYDAALFHRFGTRFRAQLNVENLFDRDYYATAHSNTNITPGSPRAFRVSLTTRF
ncbi:MAG: TonB-dependent siderophore receptor [Opitutaceae bacterium]|nr:TonB-dependent siderophore receptor [Opitutaceae bacterium]